MRLTTRTKSSLDSAWRTANELADAQMSLQFAKEARKEIEERLKGLPIGVELTDSGIVVKPRGDLAKNAKDARDSYDRMMRAYEAAASLPDTVENLKLRYGTRSVKLRLRDGDGDGDGVREEVLPLDPSSSPRIADLAASPDLLTIHTEEASLEAVFIQLTGRGLA